MIDPTFWRRRRVLLTGDTGFKGSWLALWLHELGAEIHGIALPPATQPNLYDAVGLADVVRHHDQDIRDAEGVQRVVSAIDPEITLHLAAQALVRPSYQDPIGTYATNVMGTLHVLEAVRHSSCRIVLVVTSDKCYENREWEYGYRETDHMGGADPYSSSKGCTELLAASWRRSFASESGVRLASARAGNVIGGGDFSVDRLIPDLVRGFTSNQPVLIRRPGAVRPWQHVLEPVGAYLMLAEALHRGDDVQSGWNFGPREEDARTVGWVADAAARLWQNGATWVHDGSPQPHEATLLRLDISRARHALGWSPVWTAAEALDRTIRWYRAFQGTPSIAREQTLRDIRDYMSDIPTTA